MKAKKNITKQATHSRILSPLRIILATALIIYLSFLLYRKFGISDWLLDIGFVVGSIVFLILTAFGVVALLMYIRGKTGKA